MSVSNQQFTTSVEMAKQMIQEVHINGKITSVLNKLMKQAENIHLHDYGFLLRDVNLLDRLEKKVNKNATILVSNPPIYDNGREYLTLGLCAILLYKVQIFSQEKLMNCLEAALLQHQVYCASRRFQS